MQGPGRSGQPAAHGCLKAEYRCVGYDLALIYPDLAIVSVGMSCQTAYQIAANKRHIDRWLGVEGVLHTTPFDWLICPVPAALRLLHSGRFFPKAKEQLTHSLGRISWPETGAFFWHEPDVLRDFDAVRSKFAHLEDNWRALAGRRILAFWSNSQANLDWSTEGMGVDLIARQHDFTQLDSALRQWFPDVALCPVIDQRRADAFDPPDPDTAHPYDAKDAPKDWRGNGLLWREALRKAVSRHALTRST